MICVSCITSKQSEHELPFDNSDNNVRTSENENTIVMTNDKVVNEEPVSYVTRSGRMVKPPQRY